MFVSNFFAQENTITLKSLPTGSEGNSLYNDKSSIYINTSGIAVYKDSNQFDDWSVISTIIKPQGAIDKTFDVTIGGMSDVNKNEGIDYGSAIVNGGIDRDSQGGIGVRGNQGNAIDNNEGISFGLDLSKMNASIAVQISKVYVRFVGLPNEKGIIVSRINPSIKITFGTAPGVDYQITSNEEESIDISSLNLYITDREVNTNMLSIFNDSPSDNNFRITGIELKILDNTLDKSKVTNMQHPRLLLKKGEESLLHNLVNQSSDFKELHDYIINTATGYLTSPDFIKPASGRILDLSRDAIFQLFYLSYAYRMTNDVAYLNKAESVLNTICDFNNWNNYTLDTAEICFAVAIGYDWLFDDLSTNTKEKARNAILNYALIPEKFKDFWDSTSNWNQVGIGGLSFGALAILGDGNAQMDTQATFYVNNILVKNPKSMNTYSNGNYQEGAMYWSYGTTYEVMLLSALEGIYGENHEGINRLTYSPGFLESAEFMQYVTGPTSLYFNYMDSTAKRSPLPATFWMAKKANNSSLVSEELKLLKNGGYLTTNIEETRFLPITLIYAKDIVLNNLQQPQKKLWYGYGEQPVAMVRTDWKGSTGKYFGIKAGTPTYSHGQMDAGTFVYDSQGLRWATDFGKYDYEAVGNYWASQTPPKSHSDYSQNSVRWDIFKVSNLNHNSISIKKSSETKWQRHISSGKSTLDELFDTNEKRGAKVNLKPVIGLNNELNEIFRSVYLVNEEYLEIKDEIKNGNENVDIYWNLVTTAIVEKINDSQIKLTQGGKTVVLDFNSSNENVNFNLDINRSTNPTDYFPTATYERKNTGTVMIGFTSTIPANEQVIYTVTIKDDTEIAPLITEPINYITLELPKPNTSLEGNLRFKEKSIFFIDNSGDVSISGFSTEYAWSVFGLTNISDALNSQFSFNLDAIGSTNSNDGQDYGALLVRAGIDRDSNGNMGVRGGTSLGIDPNEGFRIGFDLEEIPSSVSLQLVKVGVDFVGQTDKGVIVNRKDTSKKTTFGAPGITANVNLSKGFINVENLNIISKGGETDFDLATIFNTGNEGTFRINSFVFKVSTAVLSDSDYHFNNQIKVYPNPFSNHISIKSDTNNNEEMQLQLFNILGTKVVDKIIKNAEKINVSYLKKGVYFLKIKQGNTNINKKIIKQ